MTFFSRYARTAALLISCFFVWACENDIKDVNNFTKRQTGVEEATDVTSFMSQEGIIKAKLRAPFMLRHQADTRNQADTPYVEFPRSVHVDFFDDSTKVKSTVDALYARYKEAENKVLLRDSVVVINLEKGDTLRTSELWWDQEKEQFYTDKPVRIYQIDKTIFGKGLKAAQDFSNYEIFNITGTVLTTGNQLDSL
ncbi:MAG: LPS export ABC transporter periplasmic protein LptC [Chitinophagaceae bacterium]|nr:MAG: LPS export ABC transporter periplasmic protein LptC [Chitinophagaceae bacterium]